MTVPVVFAISGAIALLVGLLGGGIKAKEVIVKPLSTIARVITIIVGLSLIGTSLWISNSQLKTSYAATPLPTTLTLPLTSEMSSFTNTPEPAKQENTSTPDANIYIEDFSNGSKYWETGTVDNDSLTFTRSIVDNALRWQVVAKKQTQYAMGYPKLPGVSNFDMEATFNFVAGSVDVEYGLMFRRTDAGSYRFLIDQKGYFALLKYLYDENQTIQLIAWQLPIEPLNLNGENKLRVYVLGNNIKVYINDNLVGSITDDSFSSGIVDVFANFHEGEGITLDINSFKLVILSQ